MTLSKKTRIYELMTDNFMHNQYMYGVLSLHANKNPEYCMLKGVMLEKYAEVIMKKKIQTPIFYFDSRISMLKAIIRDFFHRDTQLVISGCRTYFMIFFCFFSWFKSIEVHLHGQFYGAKESYLKRMVWRFIAKRLKLVLSCPFYTDTLPVVVQLGIHDLSSDAKLQVTSYARPHKRTIGLIVGKGREKWKGYSRLERLERLGFELLWYEQAANYELEWENYLNFMRSIDYLFLNPVNDYHLYSPSGLITDSINYEKPMIAFNDNLHVKKLIEAGCQNVILVD